MAERRRVRTFEWSTAIIATISIGAALVVYLRDGTEKFLAILGNDLGVRSVAQPMNPSQTSIEKYPITVCDGFP